MISERVYRALLVLYPVEHRREYGEPMVQLFRDRMRRDGSGLRTLGVCAQMVLDLVGSAFMERKEGAMLASSKAKGIVVRSARVLFWAMVAGIGLYMATLFAVPTAGLVALSSGWYPFTFESGLLGYTVDIQGPTSFYISWELSPVWLLALTVGACLLAAAEWTTRALSTSFR